MWDEVNIQESCINQNCNNTMSVVLCTGAIFVKKNSCIVAKNSFIWYCRSASIYFLYFRAIPFLRYWAWSESRYLTFMTLLYYPPIKSHFNQCFKAILWWKYGHLQIGSYEAWVYQPLSNKSRIKWKKLKTSVSRKF